MRRQRGENQGNTTGVFKTIGAQIITESENNRDRSNSEFLTRTKRGRETNCARFFLKQKVTAFPRIVTRYDVIQHGRPDAMTFQDGRPDVIHDGGQEVTSSKMADRM